VEAEYGDHKFYLRRLGKHSEDQESTPGPGPR
jgi:hypothetical protein